MSFENELGDKMGFLTRFTMVAKMSFNCLFIGKIVGRLNLYNGL
jgi:hypothetical protein